MVGGGGGGGGIVNVRETELELKLKLKLKLKLIFGFRPRPRPQEAGRKGGQGARVRSIAANLRHIISPHILTFLPSPSLHLLVSISVQSVIQVSLLLTDRIWHQTLELLT